MTQLEQPKIDTAVVMCGGMGTRDLPHTLVRPNTLGEIGPSNAFDVITEQLARVGVENLVVVVPDDEADGTNLGALLIKRWFKGSPTYVDKLTVEGRSPELIVAAGNHSYGIGNLYFARQPADKYGTAASIAAASDVLAEIEADKFLVVNGDGFMYRTDGGSDIVDLVSAVASQGAAHGLLTTPIEKKHEGKYSYGVIERGAEGNFVRINEGPQASEVTDENPEGNVGLYLFDRSILPMLNVYVQAPLPANRKEYWITDVIETAAQEQSILAVPASGKFIDCATVNLRHRAWQTIDPVGFAKSLEPQK